MQLEELAYAIATLTLILSNVPELRSSASTGLVDTAKIFPMRRDFRSPVQASPSHHRK